MWSVENIVGRRNSFVNRDSSSTEYQDEIMQSMDVLLCELCGNLGIIGGLEL